MPDLTIYCSSKVRQLWPDPLADTWASLYPQLFDEDDLRTTRKQGKYHFAEWFAAIHLFHQEGSFSLVEKYDCSNHPRKQRLLPRILGSSQLDTLYDIIRPRRVQPPDLLVYSPDLSSFRFVEVKGPRDRLLDRQRETHRLIEQRMGVAVQVVAVALVPAAA